VKTPKSQEETLEMAQKVLDFSRRKITQLAPALLESIYALKACPKLLPGPISTDGYHLWFHPEQILSDFQEKRDAPAWQILHVTTHCLLNHLAGRFVWGDPKHYDGAADMKAAQFMVAMCGENFSERFLSRMTRRELDELPFLPELCVCLTRQRNEYRNMIKEVYSDDHSAWYPPAGMELEEGSVGGGQGSTVDWDRIRRSLADGAGGKLPGEARGVLEEELGRQDRGMSYVAFLKRFASPQERMLLDPDSFDPRWYHIGLEFLGNVPLLEPSEISELPLPDDLVVALDTSGSCSGEVCRRFVKETLGILRDISAGAPRFRILLLQCDTEIQNEILLETTGQVDELFRNFRAKGFGGTDFRPVFRRVEELRKNGELPSVRGLLYLSDGCGHFPVQSPDYPVAFLIPSEDERWWSGPDWVTRLLFNQKDYTLKEAKK